MEGGFTSGKLTVFLKIKINKKSNLIISFIDALIDVSLILMREILLKINSFLKKKRCPVELKRV